MQILRLISVAAALVVAATAFTAPSAVQAIEAKSTRLSLDTEIANTLARQTRCWMPDLAQLNDKDCYKRFEEAAYVSRTNQQLYHDVGVGQGYLMQLPSCDKDGRRSNCTVVLSNGPGVQERIDYFRQYYRGIESSLRAKSHNPLTITCKGDACSLSYL